MEFILLGIACFLMGGISFSYYARRTFIHYCQCRQLKHRAFDFQDHDK
jgi:hypothetical protein